jgi:hypothetical protein
MNILFLQEEGGKRYYHIYKKPSFAISENMFRFLRKNL